MAASPVECPCSQCLLALLCPALPAGKRLASVDVENTEENRRDWRQLLYTAPGEQTQQAGGQQAGRQAGSAVKAVHSLQG